MSQISTQTREPFPGGDFGQADGEPEAGVTARWGITPNLVASGTLNPDFSQVEADAFQLDVNERFALYYNEKRPFFYEGMEFFQTRLNSVYTRAIADPRWGFKLTGKEGRNAVGAFVAEDEITNLMFPSSEWSSQTSLETRSTAAVLRYRRDVGASSTIGAMLTSREGGGYSNRVGGVDGVLRLRDSDRIEFQGLMSRTAYPEEVAADYDQPEGEFDGGAYDVFYDHETGTWDWWLEYLEIGADFRADLGFRPQADYRQYRTGWSREWRGGPDTWYSSFDLGSGYVRDETVGRDLIQGFFDAWLNYSGPARSSLNLYATTGTEHYLGDEYDERYIWGQAGYWPTNALSVQLGGLYHQGIDYANAQRGDRWGVRPSITYKAGRLDAVYAHEFERMDVNAGRLYTANVDYLRAAYRFTRRAALRAIVQYLDYDFNPDAYTFEVAPEERCLASQLLLSYELNPQTVLYLGYSDNHEGTDVIDLTRRDRTFFVKIGYAWVL